MLTVMQGLFFCRPFISSLAFPYLNFFYSLCLIIFLAVWNSRLSLPFNKIRRAAVPLFVFCATVVLSIIFSVGRTNSLTALYNYIIYALSFIACASLTEEDKIRITQTIVASGFVVAIIALYQYFFGFDHILNYLAKNRIGDSFTLDYIAQKRVFAPFVTPNALGGYLAMIVPLALINKNRLLLTAPIFLALILTQSLGALLSLSLGLIIYLHMKNKTKKKRALLFGGILVLIMAIFVSRSLAAKQHLTPGFSALTRLGYWQDALRIIAYKPLTGLGVGNFNLAQTRYAHNSYLQMCAEMGILGTFAFFWLVFKSLGSGLRKIRSGEGGNYVVPLVAAVSIFLLHNLVDFTFFLPEVSLIWWIMLGLIAA